MGDEGDRPGAAESDVSMALRAAFGGTLALGHVFGVQTHAGVLLLLAVVAGVGFVFEKVALVGTRQRAAQRAGSDRADAAGHG